MESNQNSNRKVFVVLSRTHAKIWKDNFEPNSVPITISKPSINPEYRKMLNQYFSGRKRGELDPQFAQKIADELVDVGALYLAGGGKGKASAVQNFASYLRDHHHEIASHIRKIEDIDAENMTDGQLLAEMRKILDHELK
jgi:hypothetical protein